MQRSDRQDRSDGKRKGLVGCVIRIEEQTLTVQDVVRQRLLWEGRGTKKEKLQ